MIISGAWFQAFKYDMSQWSNGDWISCIIILLYYSNFLFQHKLKKKLI